MPVLSLPVRAAAAGAVAAEGCGEREQLGVVELGHHLIHRHALGLFAFGSPVPSFEDGSGSPSISSLCGRDLKYLAVRTRRSGALPALGSIALVAVRVALTLLQLIVCS